MEIDTSVRGIWLKKQAKNIHLIFAIIVTEFASNGRIIRIECVLRQATVDDDCHNNTLILDGQVQDFLERINVIL